MSSTPNRNRLATESSAYLLQHASNPVDWYPWGDEALQLARSLDRPILLSIGYSACHWCHVMERESFEDPDIAALMNRLFVCIKVDREERPDLDHLYMKALQGMTGRGGWPMTMFLTPDARPFYAGTYFPPEDRGGMPGFPRVLLGVSKTWAEKPEDVSESAARVVAFLVGENEAEQGGFDETTLVDAAQSLVVAMDGTHGGFGRAPKFPGTMALSLLMQAETVQPDPTRRQLVRLTLDRMAAGGIRDHLGGGFHRYSVDQVWLVPHFEKMLYDQALLAGLYADASKFFEDRSYAEVAEEILDYVVREMTSSEGGFFSAQDADSEGEEGKFFVWSRAEILEVLGAQASAAFCEAYGVTEEGNFEGSNILHRVTARGDAEAEAALETAREQLLRRRSERVPPGTDRKIVTDWNGLLISAMARGGRDLGREDLVVAAFRAAEFARTTLLGPDGLKHVFAGGVAKIPAFLDDYAFFGRACLDLFAVRPDARLFAIAVACAERLLAEFADEQGGGFWFSGSRGESLVARTCDLHDGAVPAGNSVAAELLLRLWSLTGEERYRVAGQGVIDRFLAGALRNVYGSSQLLAVAERARRGWRTVVVVGEPDARDRLSRAARDVYDPGCMVIALESQDLAWYPSALRGKRAPAGGACAYVCQGSTCTMPLATEEEVSGALRSGPTG